MHKYLRAIGFSKYDSRKEVENLLLLTEKNADKIINVRRSDCESVKQSYTLIGDKIGISSCGIEDENGDYYREFYFPYLKSDVISTDVGCELQKHSDKYSFSGMCEEYELGISLIFYLQNGMEYLERLNNNNPSTVNGIVLSGMSVSGEIILPVKKTIK